jgi:hypothetical protein
MRSVILSSSLFVTLSETKGLILRLRVNSAKDLMINGQLTLVVVPAKAGTHETL